MTPKHVSDLPALVALGPAEIVAAVKSAAEYENFHSSPAGLIVPDVSERLMATLPPAGAVAEESANETCAEAIETQARRSVEMSTNLAAGGFGMFIGLGALSCIWAIWPLGNPAGFTAPPMQSSEPNE